MLGRITNAVERVATQTYPAKRVALVRWGLGIAAIIRGIAAIPELMALADPNLLNVAWFGWFPQPSVALVVAILAIWLLSATAFTIGACTRVSGAVLSTTLAASIALDQQAYSNHLLLLAILTGLLVLTTPGAALSVDAKLRGHKTASVQGWPLFLMKLQVTVVYVFAGVTKLNDSFLSGRVLKAVIGAGVVRPPESFLVQSVLAPLALLAVATELLVAYTLWSRSFRKLGVVLGIGLHSTIALLMATTVQLSVFGIVMASSYWLFTTDALEQTKKARLRSVESDISAESSGAQGHEPQRNAA